MAAIDATVVGIALPAIGLEFHASLAELQWVVTAYTLTLAGLLLVAGALGDRYGRRPPRRPGQGDRCLVGLRWDRHGDRAVPRRLADPGLVLAADLRD